MEAENETCNIRGTAPSPVLVFRVWEVRDAWRFLKEVREQRCKCHKKVISRYGCQCGFVRRIRTATETLEQFLEEL